MKENGIIVGASVNFNYPFFGYNGVVNFLINVQSAQINEVFELLEKIPDINVCRQYSSQYNLVVVAMLKSQKGSEYRKKILSTNKDIIEIKSLLWTDVKNDPKNIFNSPFETLAKETHKKKFEKTEIAQINSIKLDEIDVKIVEKLTENGRLSFRKISQKLGVSTDTVARRYRKLVKNNLIKVSIQIDPSKLGYQALLTFLVALASNDEVRTIANALIKIPRVSYVAILTGEFDLRVVALVKDFEEMYALQEKIERISNIRKIEMSARHPRLWPVAHQFISTF